MFHGPLCRVVSVSRTSGIGNGGHVVGTFYKGGERIAKVTGRGGGPRSGYRVCVEVVKRRRRERRERGASTRHKGRGLIHRGGRTRLHAVVERISFIAILDERHQPVTRLPCESQGRESTEFPLPRPRRHAKVIVCWYGTCSIRFSAYRCSRHGEKRSRRRGFPDLSDSCTTKKGRLQRSEADTR